jgi:hypothetical protein
MASSREAAPERKRAAARSSGVFKGFIRAKFLLALSKNDC